MKDINKIKNIYRIYESSNGILHLEKHPVIYANSVYVYIKNGDKQELKRLNYDSIADDYVQYKSGDTRYYYCRGFDKYFWNIDTDVDLIFEDLKKQKKTVDISDICKKFDEQLEKTGKIIEDIDKEIAKLQNMKEQIEKLKNG